MNAVFDAQLNRRNQIENPLGEGTIPLGENDRTLPQIYRDRNLHDLFFGSHIHTINPTMAQEIALALAENPTVLWTPEQNTFLENARQSFNRQMTLANVAREAISEQEIRRMAGRDPRLQELLNRTENIADARRVMLSELNKVAIQNPVQFQRVIDNLRAARTLQSGEDAQRAAAAVTEQLAHHGITEDEYRNAMGASINADHLTDETRTALWNTMRERMSALARVGSFLSFGWVANRRFRDLEGAVTSEHDFFHQKQEHMRDIGIVLHSTLDPDMLVAVQTALRDGGRPEVRDERTVKTLPEYIALREREKNEHTAEARLNRFQEKLRAESVRLSKRPSEFSVEEQNAFNNSFIGDEERTHQKPKATGLFAALVKLLFPSRSDMESETEGWWNSMRAPATP